MSTLPFRHAGAANVGVMFKPTPASHPVPVGWRLLVQIGEAQDVTRGGIVLPEASKEAERALTIMAKVVDMGDRAYQREDMAGVPWCRPNDVVIIGRYAGQRFSVSGIEMRLINDDEVMAVVPDPSVVTRV